MNLDQVTKNIAIHLLDVLSTHIHEIGTQPVVVLHQEAAIEIINATLLESIKATAQAMCEKTRNEEQALEEATCCDCQQSYSTAAMRKRADGSSICLLCDVTIPAMGE